MQVRPEQPEDYDAVRRVNEAAFGQPDEADLVDRLRGEVPGYLGLVAVEGEAVVGHIAFTPVTVETSPAGADVRGLAPMAVLPARQRAGVGRALVRAGLDRCRVDGATAVVVLGHPSYYPLFGFRPAGEVGLRSEYDAPPEAFLVRALVPGGLKGLAGTVRYAAAFGG